MRKLIIMKKLHRIRQLIRYVSYLIQREGFIVVVLEKIKNARSKDLESDADVALVLERIQDFHAEAKKIAQLINIQSMSIKFAYILVRQPLKRIDFQLCSVVKRLVILYVFKAIALSITLSIAFTTFLNVPSPSVVRILYRLFRVSPVA